MKKKPSENPEENTPYLQKEKKKKELESTCAKKHTKKSKVKYF